ncbi:type I 3-dehydroquinate dehydratase [Neobacillus sp. PS3-12]|uniref:type I 3-dehydroquinate dehydratase n=1 Tax=Neobacillus sp. PS3-12 TaxID=3070677 RepID=UPI0027E0E120|nr:type I 3-dehydroquinate dehydratase [Neobacillus sp. PS3-12]WML51767.1 type I 3-dehydroquinate dehydratase [Neobacillus sp. PS3-12]
MSTLKIKNLIVGEGTPKIIVPLIGKTKEQIIDEAELVKELRPDVVEWRVDFYEEVENLAAVKELLVDLRNLFADELLLFTFRTHKEGGNKEISNETYVELNQTAILTKNIDLVDVELFTGDNEVQAIVSKAKENGVFVIMSNHDFFKTPPKEEIVSRLRKMQEYGADIPKIAVMPTNAEDVLTLLDATNTMKKQYADRPIITMSMGGTGVISRLSCEVFGSAFTFGAGKSASAPGQIPVAELRNVLEILHKSM